MFKLIVSQIPNTITCLSLVCGCLSVVCSFRGSEVVAGSLTGYSAAMLLIGVAAVCDFLDGAMARQLKAYSELGKQLDSLSDLVSFGVAPGLLVYNVLGDVGLASWLPWFAVLIPVCGEIRLARFNIDDRQTTSFLGLPIPANAIFWIGISWALLHGGVYSAWSILGFIILIPLLMVTTSLKMFSLKFKNFAFRENLMRYLMIAIAAVCVLCLGVSGLAWTIVAYILLSLIGSRNA